MGKKLYVGNLGYNVDKSDLEKMFAAHGTVASAQVITDRETGRSKGFGFVEMGTDQEAQAAIAALAGKSLDGRNLTVNEARPQEGRSGGGGGGGFGGARRGGGGGGGGGGGFGSGGRGGAGGGGGTRY
ncbi:RNP-1 like RNA-binding protein [Candidatus Accumulibacter aalborgensis]|uniref:RNP-1 like RNA-binding protein n=1 Tax=Candidatus Accumulibacter aalborgensis TaxID=1860102 RepID=A0A1A8XVI6_9PROT|nr:RNA-binding protein [Candidatus Accumulibacter aalborgensis]SBT07983.1 RNP-1 like RNA-binding protein [Candidatus Accumulibacter aalborgensis]